MDPLQAVLKELETLYTQLSLKLTDPSAPNNPLSRKSISQLSNKIYPLLQGKEGDQNKVIFLRVCSSHATNYLNNNLIALLIRSPDQETFLNLITQGWHQYTRFLFTYHALLVHANDYFQKQSVNTQQRLSPNKTPPKEHFTVLPVSALGLRLFQELVLARFQNRLERGLLWLLTIQRERELPQDDRIRTILNMYWSCSLGELARLKMSKNSIISFWKQKSRNIASVFRRADKNQQIFNSNILSSVAYQSARYYDRLYWNSLRQLHAYELIQHLDRLCKREELLAEFHLPSEEAIRLYLGSTRDTLLGDLEGILQKQMGFKNLFLRCSQYPEEVLPQALLYFSVLKRIQEQSVPLVCKILSEAIAEKGSQISSKISKSRQYISLMISFKKSVRKIFDLAQSRYLSIEQTMQKQFKKMLQPLECTKALAEYSDFTVKQCVRLKLDEDGCEVKFRDILFLLSSISAKDSFLLHYQQYLSRRLLDSVNQPRTDIENIMLKLLGEQLGNITVAHHLSMVKDIDNSIQASEQLHNRLPFVSYKWDLRVFNPAVWPQSSSRHKYSHIEPPYLIKSHFSILEQLYLQHFGVALKLRLDRGTSLFEGKFSNFKVRFQSENSYFFLLLHLSEQPSGKSAFSHLKTLFVSKKEDKNSPLANIIQVLIQARLLIRQNKEGLLQSEEMISLNYDYKPPEGFKPQVPIIIKPSQSLLKTFAQNNIDETRIIKERQKLIDAMLVKLLKHSNATKGNRISFIQLYEGIHSNNFLKSLQIPQSVVKQRLEYLIAKQFCSRDEEDRRVYHYIA